VLENVDVVLGLFISLATSGPCRGRAQAHCAWVVAQFAPTQLASQQA